MNPNGQRTSLLWRNHPVKGVIFDMDGVIADTRAAHIKAWETFAFRENCLLDMEDFIRKTFGRSNMQNLVHFYPDRIDDKQFYARKSTEKEDLFLEHFLADRIPPLPGLLEFLAQLTRLGVSMSVGSSAPRKNIDTVLHTYAITGFFPVIASMEDVLYSKPDPQIFLLCCQRMNLDPHDCVVFEDSIHGLEAARAAGCRAVGITSMHNQEEIRHLCEIAVPDFTDFVNIAAWKPNRMDV